MTILYTSLYPYGDEGEEVKVSVEEVLEGLSTFYKTSSVEATIRAAYAGFNTPACEKHLNGEIITWVAQLNKGEVPYFMGIMYLVRVRKIELRHYAKVDGPLSPR